MPDSPFLLSVRALRVSFARPGFIGGRSARGVRAVDGVDLDVPRGRIVGLVGESGSGKTTLGRAILRLVEADSGSVVFDGLNVLRASRGALFRFRRDAQVVFQDPFASLNPRMSVGRIVGEPLTIHRVACGRELRRRVGDLLERVGLRADHADRYPHEFSGGQRQRIGIARAIALRPRFLVLDEPVSALDVSIQAQIINLVDDLRRDLSLTCLFIAHDLAVVRHLCDRIAVMFRGRIVEEATTDDLFRHPRHPYTRSLIAAADDSQPFARRSPPSPVSIAAAEESETPASGCAYLARCGQSTERCVAECPESRSPDGAACDHRVACHHAERIALVGIVSEKKLATGAATS